MAGYDGNNNQQQNIQMDSRSYTSEHLEAVERVQSCKDYYEILGVTKEVTDTELKSTYRKLALQLHPDKNKAPGAEDAFKAVGNAFAVLSDDKKREEYDVYGPEGAPQARSRRSSSPDGFYGGGRYYGSFMSAEEMFERLFSNMFFGEKRAREQREQREQREHVCWKHKRFGNKARACAEPDLCKMNYCKPKAKWSTWRAFREQNQYFQQKIPEKPSIASETTQNTDQPKRWKEPLLFCIDCKVKDVPK